MSSEIILSGIQPSGKLHIGNYLGALKNFVKLQNEHECYFFIADYHSITQDYDPKTKQQQITEVAKDFLAAGLDPKKCTIFVQSCIQEHTELAWIFNCITPISHLGRMTQYKDKSDEQEQNINVGLFDYPVLQAADILMYKVTAVPVGGDQDQHIELTRQIARFFNNRFGKTFLEPKALHTDLPRVMSLLSPRKKMSKSLGDNHCIYIDDSPEIIKKKISKAVTDSGEGQSLGAQNLLELVEIFSDKKIFDRFMEESSIKELKYSELKRVLAQDITDYFADFRKAKAKISDKEVKKVLDQGNNKARKVAEKTMEEVRSKIGIR